MSNKKPDIYLIILDCLSGKIVNEELSKEKTIIPNLKKFALETTFYPNCFSPSTWSVPSHVSLFTGLYPSEHRIDGYKLFSTKGFPTISKLLDNISYETYGYFANGYFDEFFGLGEGFKNMPVFWDKPLIIIKTDMNVKKVFTSIKKYGFIKYLEVSVKKIINRLYKILSNKISVRKNSQLSTKGIIKKTIETIEKRDKPKFVCINLMETHRNFNPPKWVRRKFNLKSINIKQDPISYFAGRNPISEKEFQLLKEYYRAEIFYLDYELKSLLKKLSKENNAFVIITADHGIHVGENKPSMLGGLRLFDIFFSIYNEVINVPFIVKLPKDSYDLKDKKRLVQNHDIFNTICDLTGLEERKTTSSCSLLSKKTRDFLKSELISTDYQTEGVRDCNQNFGNSKEEEYLIQKKIAIITKELKKYIFSGNGEIEVYNLNYDPNEQKNLFKPGYYIPDFIKKETKFLREKVVSEEAVINNEEEIKKRLRNLGYM